MSSHTISCSPEDGTRAVAESDRRDYPARQATPGGAGVDDEYIVIAAAAPISAFARGRGPTPKAAASDFCMNLRRIADCLEKLADARLIEQSPMEALALRLRALGLLEKALNVSLAEEET